MGLEFEVLEKYQTWLEKSDENTQEELLKIKENTQEIKESFYKALSFGTAGLRGKLGAGSNRMNHYTVGQATQGIANYILQQGTSGKEKGVVIAYDSRHYSKKFAEHTASILTANEIKVYLFESLRPTPELSFAIRKLDAISGVNITASHNPKEYNGYKVYWEDGAQVGKKVADDMTACIEAIDMFSDVKKISLEEAIERKLLVYLGKEMDDSYLDMVINLAIADEEDLDKTVSIVYTPLNGAGSIPVKTVLRQRGFTNFVVVPEQENPDPDFTTVGYPNPEDPKAFAYAQRLGKERDAEILIATDPDSDRFAMEVRTKNGDYTVINGNQTGVILINYILESRFKKGQIPKKGAMVKSIVTGNMGKAIASYYGVEMFETLTGFKNICGKIPKLEQEGYTYLFGYEESVGYAASDKVRDKDGVSTSMLICEAAAYYKKQNKNFLDVLEELYQRFGYYQETQISLVYDGIEGAKRIERMMKSYRSQPIMEFTKIPVKEEVDYKKGYGDIEPSNVLKYVLEDESWFAIRPSGTEPKIKIYIYTKADTRQMAQEKIKRIESAVVERLEKA